MRTILLYTFTVLLILTCSCKKDKPIEPITPQTNTQDTIVISNNISKDVFWTKDHIYHIINDIRIQPNVIIHIAEGTIIRLGKGVIIMNENGGSKTDVNGRILAKGTPEFPVIFTSLENQKAAGDWATINLIGESPSEFEYCHFEYGGYNINSSASAWGMITMYGGKAGFRNCLFSNSAKYGIYCMWADDRFTFFENNTFTGMDLGSLSIDPNSVSSIGLNNTFQEGKLLVVHGGAIASDFSPYHVPVIDVHVWSKQNVPYTVEGEITVSATLEIEKGTEMLFEPYAKLIIGSTYAPNTGELICQGTVDDKIVMTANQSNWRGILFQNTKDRQCVLNYCQVLNAGDLNDGAIVILNQEGERVSISNTEIAFSPGYGIFKDDVSAIDPTLTNINFHDNGKGDKNW